MSHIYSYSWWNYVKSFSQNTFNSSAFTCQQNEMYNKMSAATATQLPTYMWRKLEMWRSLNLNFTTFELRMFSTDLKFDKCFNCFVVECKFVEKSLFYDWFHMHREPESADKPLFSPIQPITQTTVIYYIKVHRHAIGRSHLLSVCRDMRGRRLNDDVGLFTLHYCTIVAVSATSDTGAHVGRGACCRYNWRTAHKQIIALSLFARPLAAAVV